MSRACLSIVLCIWLSVVPTIAATINAASASEADFSTALAACAATGDILSVPGGTATWITTKDITNQVTILFTGAVLSFGGGVPLFNFYGNYFRNGVTTLADLQINPGSSPPSSAWYYVRDVNTNNNLFVITNVFANGVTAPAPFVDGAVGVMTRCSWRITNSVIGLYIYHENWNGSLFSSGSFFDPIDWESERIWIVEDSWMHRTGATYAFTDAYRGARYGVRYSFLTNCWLEAHGTESGFLRGTRAVFSYFNHFEGDGSSSYAHNFRSSTSLTYSNTFGNSSGGTHFAHQDAYRKVVATSPWGQATGDSPIDDNSATIFDSGTLTSAGTLTATDSGKSWTVNQWVGYSIARMTPVDNLLMDLRAGYITANTSDTLTFSTSIGGGFPDMDFDAGDTYRILKINQVFDMPGMKDSVQIEWQKNTSLGITSNVATATKSSHGLTTGDVIVIGQIVAGVDEVSGLDHTVMAEVTVLSSSRYTFRLDHPVTTNASAQYEGYFTKVNTFSQTVDPSYAKGNTREGGVAVGLTATPTFIVENVHFFNNALPGGYAQIQYPHRILGAPSTARQNGKVKLRVNSSRGVAR